DGPRHGPGPPRLAAPAAGDAAHGGRWSERAALPWNAAQAQRVPVGGPTVAHVRADRRRRGRRRVLLRAHPRDHAQARWPIAFRSVRIGWLRQSLASPIRGHLPWAAGPRGWIPV